MKKILRSLYWYVGFYFGLVWHYPQIMGYKKKQKGMTLEEFDWHVYYGVSSWANGLVRRAAANVILEGNRNYPDGPVLFVSNHQSNLDNAVIMKYVEKPKGFVSKLSIRKSPILGTWMVWMNSLFINREDPKKAGKSLLKGVETLKEGHSLVIYPTGTRTKSNEIGEFKGGAFLMATKAKVPIIPITLYDTHMLCEGNGNFIVPRTVRIFIHDPIETKDLTKAEGKELPNIVHKLMEEKVKEFDLEKALEN
ncbi:MAG: lysophospholipid acyltransferase family protein [Lachnospirales bacterium]